MLKDTPIFPIQIQHNNDDHSLTYSSADSSIGVDEDASIFSLDGMTMLEGEEEHFVGTGSGFPSPSSFVELEQSIHELEKCYAQCIKSSPQKGTGVSDGSKSQEDGEEMMKRKEANHGNIIVHLNHDDQPRLACARVPSDLCEKVLVKQEEMIFKRQRLHQEGGATQNRSSITGYYVARHSGGNATTAEKNIKNISLPATRSDTMTPNKSAQSKMYRVSNDLDLEG